MTKARRTDPKKQPGLIVEQVFLVSAEFGHRADYLQLPPTTRVDDVSTVIETAVISSEDGRGAGIKVVARTDASNPKAAVPLYNFRVEMAALVRSIDGEENMPPLDFVAGSGMATLLPFLREAVANLTMRGRFGPIWLKPVNIRMSVEDIRKRIEAAADKKLKR